MERTLTTLLILHIAAGFTALLSGLLAMMTRKGGKMHRLGGKIYFRGMTLVFITAIILSVARHLPFLLMVGFFSYYMVVRGYRILYLKKVGAGQRIGLPDRGIFVLAAVFILGLLIWGIGREAGGDNFGRVAILFGSLGAYFLVQDLIYFVKGPKDKQQWLFTHIGSMGGAYIATLTAFIVTNFSLQPEWLLWTLPTLVGVPIIRLAMNKVKRKIF